MKQKKVPQKKMVIQNFSLGQAFQMQVEQPKESKPKLMLTL